MTFSNNSRIKSSFLNDLYKNINLFVILLTFTSLFNLSESLFQDQVGKFDWYVLKHKIFEVSFF